MPARRPRRRARGREAGRRHRRGCSDADGMVRCLAGDQCRPTARARAGAQRARPAPQWNTVLDPCQCGPASAARSRWWLALGGTSEGTRRLAGGVGRGAPGSRGRDRCRQPPGCRKPDGARGADRTRARRGPRRRRVARRRPAMPRAGVGARPRRVSAGRLRPRRSCRRAARHRAGSSGVSRAARRRPPPPWTRSSHRIPAEHVARALERGQTRLHRRQRVLGDRLRRPAFGAVHASAPAAAG